MLTTYLSFVVILGEESLVFDKLPVGWYPATRPFVASNSVTGGVECAARRKEHRGPMQLYLIRHAQSENNLLFVQTGSMNGRSVDPALSAAGRQQAKVLAGFLGQDHALTRALTHSHDPQNVQGFHFTHLYCSLMVRAVATGAEVARALNLPLVAWEDLHEAGGIYRADEETGDRTGLPGKGRTYYEHLYPGLVLPAALGEQGWWNRPFEEREAVRIRARRFLAELRQRHGDSEDRVVAITHGGFYNEFLRVLLGVPEEPRFWFTFNNTAITRIDFEGDEAWLSYMNRLEFMPRDLIT